MVNGNLAMGDIYLFPLQVAWNFLGSRSCGPSFNRLHILNCTVVGTCFHRDKNIYYTMFYLNYPLSIEHPGLQIRVCNFENYFLYFSSKIYVVGTQMNRLNETVSMRRFF